VGSKAYSNLTSLYVNDERYQHDATIMIYYHKYLYMFRASICPSLVIFIYDARSHIHQIYLYILQPLRAFNFEKIAAKLLTV